MQSTGIIRRIDSLGRIVIPKEIRNFLHIKENSQVEIEVDNDRIILYKYSELSQENSYLQTFLNTIYDVYNIDVLITDLNCFQFVSYKYDYLKGKEISSYLSKVLSERLDIFESNSLFLTKDNILKNSYYYLKPIIKNGDIVGLCIFISKELKKDQKLYEFVQTYLDKYLE